MKIKSEQVQADGKIKVSLCMCPGNTSNCKPNDRKVQVFKTKETLEKYKTAFKISK
jgi:hypothetical protein